MVIKAIYRFVDSNLGVQISSKMRVNRKKDGSFGSCFAWKGSNDLPWGRKGLPGAPGVGGDYTD